MSLPPLQEPAGLSSDTFDPSNQQHALQDDQWSDTHDTAETDDDREVIEEATERQDDLTIRPSKIPADKTHEVDTPSSTLPELSATQDLPRGEAETGSVHSLPVVQVTEPTSPAASTPRSASSTYPAPSSLHSLAAGTPSSLDRRNRNRLHIDARTSNRISGFFSNLIHRRDHPPASQREPSVPSTPPVESSRSSSPLPSRASTPPPALPAPSLTDLGLTLASITSHLSPSHFSAPPSSGAFLQPHYLLLCHAQGLDVLPLISPPAPQPYSLIRRVPFKSIVVMEHRGVLVAIAGRRDGVRVYALEEVKRAVEWRVELEVKREREKTRREELKKAMVASHDNARDKSSEKESKGKRLPPLPSTVKAKPDRRATVSVSSTPTTPSRSGTVKRPKTPPPPVPSGPPPAYTAPVWSRPTSGVPIDTSMSRSRATSVNDVLAGTLNRRPQLEGDQQYQDTKADWASSDDEAIDPMAAPSGSEALDERTSSMANTTGNSVPSPLSGSTSLLGVPTLPRTLTSSSLQSRRNRPANLDLSLTRANPPTNAVPMNAPPSPAPTLLTLRQALLSSAGNSTAREGGDGDDDAQHGEDNDGDVDGEDEIAPSSPTTPTRERISLAEALSESRLPDIPPIGSRRPQEAILLSSVGSGSEDVPGSPRTSESLSTRTRQSTGDHSVRRRRRWSVLDGIFTGQFPPPVSTVPEHPEHEALLPHDHSLPSTEMRERRLSLLTRSQSQRQLSAQPAPIPADALDTPPRPSTAPASDDPFTDTNRAASTTSQPHPSSSSRFLPRIITNVFARRSEDQPSSPRHSETDGRRSFAAPIATQAPAPKLEYVKLPGTKGSIMIKAVETAKKSFLAILCGENGEKVELFAGTYRTALGLSRTFILPDSPKSLELQLQGDDLVEVFLVFSQNVFGLEPATVRVREVRIGRAERRAARRRARENQQAAESQEVDMVQVEEETAVSVTIGVAIAPTTISTSDGNDGSPSPSPLPGTIHPADTAPPPADPATAATPPTDTDELVTLAAAHSSSYTTFQQLTFAPNFPLAAIADEYIIPPTYASFLEYRSQHEPDVEGNQNIDLAQVQFSPPGLPIPAPAPPSQWYYRDPKGIVHGPWKPQVMQTWYKDGLLPLDLPVRREEDDDFILLKDLRLQCVDPMNPFKSSPIMSSASSVSAAASPSLPAVDPSKPLLPPISLLKQPRHFGPPALFFSSRGGHSTTIVDARGRSVLRGRFLWSPDEDEDTLASGSVRLGDVKRLEAFDVDDRAVLVAMRQGGLEAVDFGDALLLPADHSRTQFPHYRPPTSSVNRRGAFVWKIGTPISASSSTTSLSSLPSKTPTRSHMKKQSAGAMKTPGKSDFSVTGDADVERDEVLFLGRKADEVYFCEKRIGSFRILRLARTNPVL